MGAIKPVSQVSAPILEVSPEALMILGALIQEVMQHQENPQVILPTAVAVAEMPAAAKVPQGAIPTVVRAADKL